MTEESIMSLIDRLLSAANRAAVAEHDLEDLTEQLQLQEDALMAANDRIAKLEKEVDDKSGTISYQYTERAKLQKRVDELEAALKVLKEGKPDAAV